MRVDVIGILTLLKFVAVADYCRFVRCYDCVLRRYLEVVVVPCNEPGGLHLQLLPLAVISFMLYSAGFPILLAYGLFANRHMIAEDQVLLTCRDCSLLWLLV